MKRAHKLQIGDRVIAKSYRSLGVGVISHFGITKNPWVEFSSGVRHLVGVKNILFVERPAKPSPLY